MPSAKRGLFKYQSPSKQVSGNKRKSIFYTTFLFSDGKSFHRWFLIEFLEVNVITFSCISSVPIYGKLKFSFSLLTKRLCPIVTLRKLSRPWTFEIYYKVERDNSSVVCSLFCNFSSTFFPRALNHEFNFQCFMVNERKIFIIFVSFSMQTDQIKIS